MGPIFAAPGIVKIFHAAEYDLFVLKRDCGFQFVNLFDTMVSAQLLGYPSVGLASLAERHFGVNLPKDEQRSDWSQRPLSPKQHNYAAADVFTCGDRARAEAACLHLAAAFEAGRHALTKLTRGPELSAADPLPAPSIDVCDDPSN